MRVFYLFFLVFFWPVVTVGQTNLVPNGDFEDTVSCPTNVSGTNGDQIYNLKNWFPSSNSPDYYNSCALTSSLVSVPINGLGEQTPHSGSGYIGEITYGSPGDNYREIVGVELNSLLITGAQYYLSFWISSTYGNYFPFFSATNKMGFKLSTIYYESQQNPISIVNDAFAHSDSIISDTINWVRISFSFIADSNYKYLYIGNFYNDSLTDTIQYHSNFGSSGAYYFIDDVCLSTDSLFCQTIQNVSEVKISKIMVGPNPFNDFIIINSKNLTSYNIFNEFGVDETSIVYRENYNRKYVLNTSRLNSGLYYLRLIEFDKNYTFKLIKL